MYEISVRKKFCGIFCILEVQNAIVFRDFFKTAIWLPHGQPLLRAQPQ